MGAPRCDDVLLSRIVLLLSPSLAQLLGSPTVYEDQMLSALTERGLITEGAGERRSNARKERPDEPTATRRRPTARSGA